MSDYQWRVGQVFTSSQLSTIENRMTDRSRRVIELSLREALQLGHNYVDTEHILLGLVREGEGVAAKVLDRLDLKLTTVRQAVIAELTAHPAPSPMQKLNDQVQELKAEIAALRDELGGAK